MSAVIDNNKMICGCNNRTLGDLLKCIKVKGITSVEGMLEDKECKVGDKCRSCKKHGWESDGINLETVIQISKNS